MLILVGVTINFALNGGIINKAKEASKQTQIQADRELLLTTAIGCIGLDGKIDFDELDTEIAKLGFTGTHGSYTSANGNSFTIDEDGNIISEGGNSGSSSSTSSDSYSSSSSESSDEDLAYLETYIGEPLFNVIDPSGLTSNDPNLSFDYARMDEIGSVEDNQEAVFPMLYKGKSYNFIVYVTDGSNMTITGVTENSAANTNPDLVYLRKMVGKHTSELATVDSSTGEITFIDSNITVAKSFDGSPESVGENEIMIPIEYNGNEYSLIMRVIDASDQVCMAVMEGIYQPETNEP